MARGQSSCCCCFVSLCFCAVVLWGGCASNVLYLVKTWGSRLGIPWGVVLGPFAVSLAKVCARAVSSGHGLAFSFSVKK